METSPSKSFINASKSTNRLGQSSNEELFPHGLCVTSVCVCAALSAGAEKAGPESCSGMVMEILIFESEEEFDAKSEVEW